VIPAPFTYVKARTMAEAHEALATHGDEAKLLAGGHSLIPLMKLRLATPSVLVDIASLPGLSGIRHEGNELVVGALTRHVLVERSPDVQRLVPLLARTAALVGDPQVRNRGTIGGSVAHGEVQPCARRRNSPTATPHRRRTSAPRPTTAATSRGFSPRMRSSTRVARHTARIAPFE